MLVAYVSLTGNVRSFVDKLDMEGVEVDYTDPFVEVTEDFVLVAPSYDEEFTDFLSNFVEYKNNRNHLRGVAGSGSLNYNSSFCFNARDIANKYQVPLIHTFEFEGRDNDVQEFIKGVNTLGITETN
jgi:protein involved in ribonucleotide reduction